MSLRAMIDASKNENAAEVEKLFNETVTERLSEHLKVARTAVVAEMFGIDLNEEDTTDSVETEE